MRSSGWIFLLLLLALVTESQLNKWISQPGSEPGAVIPRGDLANDEQTTIEIFNRARRSVDLQLAAPPGMRAGQTGVHG